MNKTVFAFVAAGLAVRAFAWECDQVDVVDLDGLEQLCASWKAAPSVQPRKVLWFSECYGYNHHGGRCYGDWTFKRAGELSGAWTFVQVKDPKKLADPKFLADFDAICFCNSSGLCETNAPGMTEVLTAFVKGGKGIALIHSGLDAFKDSDALLDLFGGYFRGHPWHGDGTWKFLNEQPANPINASFRDKPASFACVDEIYQFPAFYDRRNCQVLISMDLSDPVTKAAEIWWAKRFGLGSTRADHDYAVSWTRTVGKGRIFYTSFGHDRGAFLDKARLHHMFAGLQFALGDLPEKSPLVSAPDAAMQRTDWSNGPWKEKLDAVVRSVRGQDLDIVLFGDSITHGWMYSKDDKWSGGKEVWAKHFGDRKTAILGMAGDRTEHLLWRVTDGGHADGWKAKRIFLMIGINNAHQLRDDGTGKDAPEVCLRGTKAIVDVLRAKHPESTIHLIGCLPTTWRKDNWVNEYNALLKKSVADGKRVVFHDIGNLYLTPDGKVDTSLFSDGIHPNPAGYEKAAVALERIIADTPVAVPGAALVSYPGEIGEKSGWKIVGSEAGKVVYIPFEGYYESKGGRLESPRFALDKNADENAWYEFSFAAKSPVDGFWWVDVFDAKGEPLPDMNSRLYASADWREYRVVVSMQCGTTQAQLAFVTTKGVAVRDVSFRRISVGDAAAWCRNLYRTLPQEDLGVSSDVWENLPRSKGLLVGGKPIRILLLGDSIVNDTWCGNVSALICERFPNARLKLSVRGSTGCWYYRDPKHFEEYVLRYRPDLVLVGGISNGKPKSDYSTAEEDMTSVIRQAQAAGIEVGVMSPPPSYEFRKSPDDRSWSEGFAVATCMPLRRDYQRAAVAKTGVAYFDLTTAPCDAIANSGKPLDWFKRDIAHNDDRGKQLIAQRLAAYFPNP